jgi:hypothetical protein
MRLTDQTKNIKQQPLLKMKHHQALKGMEIIIVVHMMLYLQFCSVYGLKT